jgi:hypothetical protein
MKNYDLSKLNPVRFVKRKINFVCGFQLLVGSCWTVATVIQFAYGINAFAVAVSMFTAVVCLSVGLFLYSKMPLKD